MLGYEEHVLTFGEVGKGDFIRDALFSPEWVLVLAVFADQDGGDYVDLLLSESKETDSERVRRVASHAVPVRRRK